MDDKLKKPYNPADTEARIYKLWEESGFFNPDVCVEKGVTDKNAEKFSMVLPPPNVTGTLHTGHAMMLAIEDIMVRYARMRAKNTLWIPGTDHAAIATESVVVKNLAKEKKSKHDLGRETFLREVETFAHNSHDTIVSQLKKMGASLDWSREAFTLDKTRETAVYAAFEQMYNDGLIYRGYRIVNWDPKGQTTVSDDEVNHEPRKGKLYYMRYSKDFPIPIATTRPETKLGDTAVAVNPDDKRYKKYIGQTFTVDFLGVNLSIQIVGDSEIDPEFGTGAVGITPMHSQTDWDIAERHNLPKIQIINEYGKLTIEHPDFKDKKVAEAREIVVTKLSDAGLLEKEEEIDQSISLSERTGAVIEPLPKLQWFVDVNKKIPSRDNKTLKELMLEPVREGKIKILPERFEKVYFNWIENLRDWCISRQIWYGHRIPAWYKGNETKVGIKSPGDGWERDPDTLDTWFSSALWTFSTLGWPKQTEDLKTFHPTSVIETGYDILFFWVARMILMSQYLLGDVPFRTIYLHGMVLDKNGKKMSKTRPETAIDPIASINSYGADALRLAMIIGNTPGNDLRLDENDIRGYGKFANKIWNASRFVLEQTQDFDISKQSELDEEDKKSDEELKALLVEITKEMDAFRYSIVAEKLYHYFWHTFADIIIERCKKKINEDRNTDSARALLYAQLEILLRALHPFMPFITEEIWGLMPHKNKKLLLVENWPIK